MRKSGKAPDVEPFYTLELGKQLFKDGLKEHAKQALKNEMLGTFGDSNCVHIENTEEESERI